MDIGTISLILLFGMFFLLAIGMPLGFASAFLAVVVLLLKFGYSESAGFEPLFDRVLDPAGFGRGPLNVLSLSVYRQMVNYVLISVPLFIFMAALLERSGIAKDMYSSLNIWMSQMRGGIAIVTSVMAVIMAAMSGIIGGEVVLLGLIALPQMLRLGYNQNLAIGTICASGSLGTMIPPSIVLIFYGLITETSIKALFTASFIPGFMLASFFILYIIIRTQLHPDQAPLPENAGEDENIPDNGGLFLKIVLGLFLLRTIVSILAGYGVIPVGEGGLGGAIAFHTGFGAFLWTVLAAVLLLMSLSPKGRLFTAFIINFLLRAGIVFVVFFGVLILRDHITGLAAADPLSEEGKETAFRLFMLKTSMIATVAVIVALFGLFSAGQRRESWIWGRGLVAPIVVIGVVLGSIYLGITGITEAAAMGVVAVLLISLLRRELSFDVVWDSLMRTLKSTGTIIWVTIGAAALAAAYTLAGGPTYVANAIVGMELPTMGIILMMMVIFLIMGMFMDWVGIVLLIMPVFLPIVMKLPIEEIGFFGQLDPAHVAIWWGVVFCMNMQVSFLSPPFGPAAFYLKSVAPPHISLTDIFQGFLPFIGIQLMALSVLLIWPNIIAVLL